MKTTTERPHETTTMRAMVITENGGPDVLTAVSMPAPTRLGSEVLVRVMAAGVNAIDADARAGRVGSCGSPDLPAVLGCDFSGVVVESPYAACSIKVGVEVYGVASTPRSAGSYAEYVSVPLLSVARKPSTLSHVEAAAVPLAALTAWGIVVDVAKSHEGQRVLVHAGAGGVGHFVVQFAAYFGAHVAATASPRNASWLRQLGAAQVIDYTSLPFEDEVTGVDVVIDLVDDDDVALRSIEVLRLGGTMVHVPTREVAGLQDRADAAGARLTGYEVAPDQAALAIIARLIDSGDVTVYVDEVYDLEDVADAHRRLAQGHTRGKLVLKIADE
jgi:NADPH:quinone reductase-like Zn-dependent oxidoreductase